jgi:hypothetical protein
MRYEQVVENDEKRMSDKPKLRSGVKEIEEDVN